MWIEVDTAKLQVALESVKSQRVAIRAGLLDGTPTVMVLPVDQDGDVHALTGKVFAE